MKHTIEQYIFRASIMVVLICMAALAYFYFIDGAFKPEINISSLTTVKSVYQRGEMVQMKISFCKDKSLPASFQWTLFDDDVPPITYNKRESPGLAKGCSTDVVRNIEIIPKYVVPGQYHFENRVSYQLNPVKSVEYVIKTNTFTIQ